MTGPLVAAQELEEEEEKFGHIQEWEEEEEEAAVSHALIGSWGFCVIHEGKNSPWLK